MSTESEFHAEVEAALDKLSTLVSQRDMRVLAEFAGGALVIGSEQGEVAEGQRELQSLFQQVFAQPARISWEWHSIRASRSGEVCWFFAEAQVVATGAESQKRSPYRLSAVLQKQQDRWVWQQFHGSEPAKA